LLFFLAALALIGATFWTTFGGGLYFYSYSSSSESSNAPFFGAGGAFVATATGFTGALYDWLSSSSESSKVVAFLAGAAYGFY
jgi:hypothetical protein